MKTITIFGGTGMTGTCAVNYAIDKGYNVKILVRDASKVPAEILDKVQVINGNVLEKEDVKNALQGSDFVVVALGTRNVLDDGPEFMEGPSYRNDVLDQIFTDDPEKITVETALEQITTFRPQLPEELTIPDYSDDGSIEVPVENLQESYTHMWDMYNKTLKLVEKEHIKDAWEIIYEACPRESQLNRFNTLMLLKLQDHVHREKVIVEENNKLLHDMLINLNNGFGSVRTAIKSLESQLRDTVKEKTQQTIPHKSPNITNQPTKPTTKPTKEDPFLKMLKQRKIPSKQVQQDIITIDVPKVTFNPTILGPEEDKEEPSTSKGRVTKVKVHYQVN